MKWSACLENNVRMLDYKTIACFNKHHCKYRNFKVDLLFANMNEWFSLVIKAPTWNFQICQYSVKMKKNWPFISLQ